MIELCPFCGSRADVEFYEGFHHYQMRHMDTPDKYRVFCKNRECGVVTKYFLSKLEAIQAWNRRVK